MDGCPHCIDSQESACLIATPRENLWSEDLGPYAFKAISSWGNQEDYKYFFPRILELALYNQSYLGFELGLIISKITACDLTKAEHLSIKNVFFEIWKLNLEQMPEESRFPVKILLEDISPLVNVEILLSSWAKNTTLASALHLTEFIAYDWENLSLSGQVTGFPFDGVAVSAWLKSKERQSFLINVFESHLDTKYGNDLAEAIDRLRLITLS